ncbi:hypothetical protein G6677_06880 [Polynucleobacter paneuropaeus]|nr:hypothetical protein [Polynucleobacter paneuropaeus]
MNQYLQIPFDFFNHPFFVIFGGVSASMILLGLVYRIILWVLGITPIVIRLGVGLWRRKIAIIGSFEAYQSLSKCAYIKWKVTSTLKSNKLGSLIPNETYNAIY